MNTTTRVADAYRVIEEAAPGLMLGNNPTSGFTLLAHAALVSGIQHSSHEQMAAWAERVAADIRQNAPAV